MDEFLAIAQILLDEIQGRPTEEQLHLIAWAIATERYRTLNELQALLANTRLEVDSLLPDEFHKSKDRVFIFKLITAAERSRSRKNRQ